MPKHLISVRSNTHSEKEIIGQAGREEREREWRRWRELHCCSLKPSKTRRRRRREVSEINVRLSKAKGLVRDV